MTTTKEKLEKVCLSCDESFVVYPSSSYRKYCSQNCYGQSIKGKAPAHLEERKLAIWVQENGPWNKGKKGLQVAWNKGKPPSKETREKISAVQKGKPKPSIRGSKSHFWKGGVTPINAAIRESLEYKVWRTAVFERDNYTCVWCDKSKGATLNADHIKRFSDYPELRFEVSNGRTLCLPCHKKTGTWGRGKTKRTAQGI